MKIFVFFISVIFNLESFADTRSYDRTWFGLFSKRSLSDSDYSIWTEGQARLDNDEFTSQQVLLRPGVLKKINDKNDIGFLIAFVEMNKVWETRPTFQYIYTFAKNDVHTISLRNRFEYRKREDQDAVSGRYRGLLRFQFSLENKKAFIIWDEPFLNMTNEDWTGNRIFERNRFFIGMGIPFLDTNFEVGYMNQYTPRDTRTTVEHIATVYYFY